MNNRSRKLQFALVAVLTAALFLSVAALASVGKGKPGKGKNASAAQYQYGPSGKQYGKTKVTLCHKGKTLKVGAPAAKAHLRHGDKLGAC
jgi:hypothetical protein